MPDFRLKIADTAAEVKAAQRLRFNVFVQELGGVSNGAAGEPGLDQDEFDPVAEHLILIDQDVLENSGVVGTYRLVTQKAANSIGHFYSACEFDLSPLTNSGARLLELGRSCIHPQYRGGTAMYELWAGLARLVEERGIDILFGVASFHGTNLTEHHAPLALLAREHLASERLRVTAVGAAARELDPHPTQNIDRRAALAALPALIKGYLRLGGKVGAGAWIDHDFNTTDVCMILERSAVGVRQRAIYARGTQTR